MLRVILVDDEPLARLGMRQLLAEHPSMIVVGEAQNATVAAELIRREKPDGIFLDIHMPRANGFDLLGKLEGAPKVIFVTAHSEHAVKAFEVQAVDYLLKPVRRERLADAVNRLTAACSARVESTPYKNSDRLCLRTPQRTLVADLKDIIALEADGDFTRLHISGEAPLMICQSLQQYEATLPSPPFLRVGRSLMVNLDRVTKTEPLTRDTMNLWLSGLSSPFPLGRRAQARLKKYLS